MPKNGQASGIAIIGMRSKSGGEMRKSTSDHPALSWRAIKSANKAGSSAAFRASSCWRRDSQSCCQLKACPFTMMVSGFVMTHALKPRPPAGVRIAASRAGNPPRAAHATRR
jgi:hypothetical protein